MSVQHQDMLGKKVDELPQLALVLPKFVLGPLPILDVRSRCIPAGDAALVVEHRVVLNEKPSVLAICSAGSLLALKRNDARERTLPIVAKSRNVFGMEDPFAKVVGLHLVERQSRVSRATRFA